MKILGINACGWLEVAHDASAVLVEDGKIKWAIEEERLIRQKRAYDKKPINAIHFCLNNEGILLDEIDRIVFSWDWKNYGPEEAKKFETSRFLLDKFFPKNTLITRKSQI